MFMTLHVSYFSFLSSSIMSSPGHIIVTGIVILENARPVKAPKGTRNVAFDVNFPVNDGKKRTLGLLRYFTPEERINELQQVWKNDFTEAFIIANQCYAEKWGPI